MTPRLTIGIPTYNRPEMVARAIESALAQTTPARIIVADDGTSTRTMRTCRALEGDDFFYYKNMSSSLWENWKLAAREAIDRGDEFFAWLPDDDVIVPEFAERVIVGFDRYPEANVWLGKSQISYDGKLGCSFYVASHPKLCLDYLRGRPSVFDGRLLSVVGYVDSWAQSPAKAFRCGPAFAAMLDALPDGCDKFTERLDIATMGLSGPAIADPNVAGYWVQHAGNESTVTESLEMVQARIAFRYLDLLNERVPQWEELFWRWLDTPGIAMILQGMYNETTKFQALSPVCWKIREMIAVALRVAHGMEAPRKIIA